MRAPMEPPGLRMLMLVLMLLSTVEMAAPEAEMASVDGVEEEMVRWRDGGRRRRRRGTDSSPALDCDCRWCSRCICLASAWTPAAAAAAAGGEKAREMD